MTTTNTSFCPIRNIFVAATPEEEVRVALLRKMLEEWGHSRELIIVERPLSALPHLCSRGGLPMRRIDILLLDQDLSPYLLVECKANAPTKSCLRQVIGYNHFVQAPFIALAGPSTFKIYAREENYAEVSVCI